MKITEDVVKLVARKLSGSLVPGVMDSEDLQGWLLKIGDERKCFCSSVFFDWLENQSLPWAAYREIMSGRLISLDKQPGLQPLGVREN